MSNASNPTLDQRRARHAWEAISGICAQGKAAAEEYAREAKKLPMRIKAAGLGQALAFVLAKANNKTNLTTLHANITNWVLKERNIQAQSPDNLMESIIKGDAEFLRRATDETLAYLQWLNRFAEAKLGDVDQEG